MSPSPLQAAVRTSYGGFFHILYGLSRKNKP